MAPCPSKLVAVAAAVLVQLHRGAEGSMMLRGAQADAASQPVGTPVSADWNPDAEADADWKQMLADGSVDGADAAETTNQEEDVRADEDTDINDPDDAPADKDQVQDDVADDEGESLMMQTKAKSDKDVTDKDDRDDDEDPDKEMQAEVAKMKAEGTFDDDDVDSAQNAKESDDKVDCDSGDVICNKGKSDEYDDSVDAVAVEGESLAQVGSREDKDDDADGEDGVDDDGAVDEDLDGAEDDLGDSLVQTGVSEVEADGDDLEDDDDDEGLDEDEDDDEDDDDAADDEDADDDLD